MLTDAGAPCHNPDMDQAEIPEAAEPGIALYGNIEGVSQLDGPPHSGGSRGFVGGFYVIGNVVCPGNLGTEKVKQLFCLRIDAARQLNLFHHLVGAVIQLLLGGDD